MPISREGEKPAKLSLEDERNETAAMARGIVADPAVLGGKPCVRGTRLSVEFILELIASGATRE